MAIAHMTLRVRWAKKVRLFIILDFQSDHSMIIHVQIPDFWDNFSYGLKLNFCHLGFLIDKKTNFSKGHMRNFLSKEKCYLTCCFWENLWNLRQSESILGPISHVEFLTEMKIMQNFENYPSNISSMFGAMGQCLWEIDWNVKNTFVMDAVMTTFIVMHLPFKVSTKPFSPLVKGKGQHVSWGKCGESLSSKVAL